MYSRHRRQGLVSEINITPLTDVILVLLIIFMIVTPLIIRTSINIELPKVSTSQELSRDISILVTSSGDAVVANVKYSLRFDSEFLKFKLKALIKNPVNTTVVIYGDRKVEYDFVIKVMDVLSQIGVTHIALAAEFSKGN